MEKQKRTGFIFSVDRDDKEVHQNEVTYNAVLDILKNTGSEFKTVVTNADNKETKSFYLEPNYDSLNEMREYVNALCTQYGQTSFLEISPERVVRSYSNGLSNILGSLVSVYKEEAEKEDSFIFCPKTTRYYVIRL